MTLLSTPNGYGSVAIVLHWLIAVFVLAALASGFVADALGPEGRSALRIHLVTGLAAALLTLFRIVWWITGDRRPRSVDRGSGLQKGIARVVHVLLYLVPLGMAVSGVLMLALSGAGAQLAPGAVGPLPEFERYLHRQIHGAGARFIVGATVLHVVAALYHHYVLRDGLLSRMRWPRGLQH